MRPREGGNFGERVVRDLLNADGGWCIDGPLAGGWDLEWSPPAPYMPVFLEVKSSKDREHNAGLSLDEVEFRDTALAHKFGWALVRVVYRVPKRRHAAPIPVSVSLDQLEGVAPVVRNALTLSLGREWRPARREG